MVNANERIQEPKSARLREMLKKLGAPEAHGTDEIAQPSAGQLGNLAPARIPFGIAEIDRALDPVHGAGIVANALHEVRVESGLNAACGAGFALALGLMTAGTAPEEKVHTVFWISDTFTCDEYGRFYGPGLSLFNLKPENFIRIHPQGRREMLWAAGEIAATPNAAAFCLIEITKHPGEIDLTATRRLMLRAQSSGTPVILLRQSGNEEASAAHTRWRVRPAASAQSPAMPETQTSTPLQNQFIGPPAFAVSLEKCRGGHADPSTQWTIEWNRDDQRFTPITSDGKSGARPASVAGRDRAFKFIGGQAGESNWSGTPLSRHSSANARHRPDPQAKTG
jgi:protein ImuA